MIDIILLVVIALQLSFIVWREIFFNRQQEALFQKLMAKDFKEYAVFTQQPKAKEEKEKKKRTIDPVMGAI